MSGFVRHSIVFLFLLATLARADRAPLITHEEFEKLAIETAQKVNLFRDVWTKEPTAEFFGGASRDYLYWLKGQLLRNTKSRKELERRIQELKATPVIDVRAFIGPDSDVDIISKHNLFRLDAKDYGIQKLDWIQSDRLDPKTPEGRSEIDQGYIPIEKIRLAKTGIIKSPQFGNGLDEILSDRLSAVYADPKKFARTSYARSNYNHRVLLPLRFLRLVATHYYSLYGTEPPDQARLLNLIEKNTIEATKGEVRFSLSDPKLSEMLQSERFARKVNRTVHKAFRSYVNPTAAHQLLSEFGLLDLIAAHPQLEKTNQYLFSKNYDSEKTNRLLEKYRVNSSLFFESTDTHFPDLKIYHGTKTEEAFRNILFTGILPSTSGNAGDGLYGVRESNKSFAIDWGGSKKRLVRLDVKPEAKVVDITHGEGERVHQAFIRQNPSSTLTDFAVAFGIDIIKYPYQVDAYVVKNGAAIGNPEGVFRKFLTLGEMLLEAKKIETYRDLRRFMEGREMRGFTKAEKARVVSAIPYIQRLTQSSRSEWKLRPQQEKWVFEEFLEHWIKQPNHWKEYVLPKINSDPPKKLHAFFRHVSDNVNAESFIQGTRIILDHFDEILPTRREIASDLISPHHHYGYSGGEMITAKVIRSLSDHPRFSEITPTYFGQDEETGYLFFDSDGSALESAVYDHFMKSPDFLRQGKLLAALFNFYVRNDERFRDLLLKQLVEHPELSHHADKMLGDFLVAQTEHREGGYVWKRQATKPPKFLKVQSWGEFFFNQILSKKDPKQHPELWRTFLQKADGNFWRGLDPRIVVRYLLDNVSDRDSKDFFTHVFCKYTYNKAAAPIEIPGFLSALFQHELLKRDLPKTKGFFVHHFDAIGDIRELMNLSGFSENYFRDEIVNLVMYAIKASKTIERWDASSFHGILSSLRTNPIIRVLSRAFERQADTAELKELLRVAPCRDAYQRISH